MAEGDTIATAQVSNGATFAFESLDTERIYTLYVNDEPVQELTFAEPDQDINLEINEETLLLGDVNRDANQHDSRRYRERYGIGRC